MRHYEQIGPAGGAKLHLRFTPKDGSLYKLQMVVRDRLPVTLSNPLHVEVRVGDDRGEASRSIFGTLQ